VAAGTAGWFVDGTVTLQAGDALERPHRDPAGLGPAHAPEGAVEWIEEVVA
jgi:hypothetical protein